MQIEEVMFLNAVLLRGKTTVLVRRKDKYELRWDGAHRGILVFQPEPGAPAIFVPWPNIRQVAVDPELVNNDGRKKEKDGEGTRTSPTR